MPSIQLVTSHFFYRDLFFFVVHRVFSGGMISADRDVIKQKKKKVLALNVTDVTACVIVKPQFRRDMIFAPFSPLINQL